MAKGAHRAAACFAAATCHCLLQRRHRNASERALPLEHDSAVLLKKITQTVASVAAAHRTIAIREETRIYTHYEGWLPEEDGPVESWENSWLETKYATLRPSGRVEVATPPLLPTAPHAISIDGTCRHGRNSYSRTENCRNKK